MYQGVLRDEARLRSRIPLSSPYPSPPIVTRHPTKQPTPEHPLVARPTARRCPRSRLRDLRSQSAARARSAPVGRREADRARGEREGVRGSEEVGGEAGESAGCRGGEVGLMGVGEVGFRYQAF